MPTTQPDPTTTQGTASPPDAQRWPGWLLVVGLVLVVILVFTPLLRALGRITLRTDQLASGGLLVVVATIISLRDALHAAPFQPQLGRQGILLAAWGFICLGLSGFAARWTLPLALLSFCLCVGAVISFLYGRVGVRQFLPAIGAFFVFGLLAGVFPTLDWPLRAIAGRQAANVLEMIRQPVELLLASGRLPELLLRVGNSNFIVATECNGFGLLTSALLVATILAFQLRLPWLSKVGLVALAVPIAIICNFLRIVGITLIAPRVPLPYGFVHEVVGLVFYLAGLAMIWFASRQEPKPC